MLSVSYIPPHQPVHLKKDLEYISNIGCSDVVFALQENHFQWLNGAIRFGPSIAKDMGLRPRALLWGYANTSGGGRSSRVMLENPDMWRRDKDGQPYCGGYPHPQMCYNNAKSADKYVEYVAELERSGFMGVIVDEPSPQDCFCAICKEKFRVEFGADLTTTQGSAEYRQFQKQTVSAFVLNCLKGTKMVSNNLETSVCIMPCDRELFPDVVSIPELDVFCTDPYWLRPINELTFQDAIDVSLYAKQLAKVNNKKLELALGCFGIAANQGLEEQIYSGGKILYDRVRPDIYITWSFRGGIGLGDVEECDNPELAWQNVVKLYGEINQSLRKKVSARSKSEQPQYSVY